MFTAFDSLALEVPDLDAALSDYATLLGMPARDNQFSLANLCLRLRASPGIPGPRISALSLLDDRLNTDAEEPIEGDCRGLTLLRANCRGEKAFTEPATDTGIHAVDHVVLRSSDADDCIRLFGDELGLRLALDQTVPEFGGRMLFFRHGKMTLEVIQSLDKPPQRDAFWGISFLCRDIDATIAALDRRGVAHSEIRTGRKPGTRVATLRSHCLGLPTLVIGPG